MINISFPDGSKKTYQKGITPFEIASSISTFLAKNAFLAEINGKLKDITETIEQDSNIKILTITDPESLETIRHDAAHIMAQAVQELFKDVQVTIGPAIENGFYYDFATKMPFTIDDLQKIEARMREIVKRDDKIIREVWDRDDAIKFFTKIGENYKAEIISFIPKDEQITLYRQGNFIDLCRGPHAPSTGKIKYFKLMKLAGAYWRGNSKNQMLQRIYGTAWGTKEDLDNYLTMLEEAEKRDHRKIGKELGLFHFQEEAQGMPFWHEKGWNIYLVIESYIRQKMRSSGYIEVKTPILINKNLWEASGHWEKFRDDMFVLEAHDQTLAIKPMNCPAHVQIFKQGIKSYKDLPIRMAEFGCCHRNEASGGLHGLMRVRSFVQDDAHIFCTKEQITDETVNFCKLLTEIYEDFGFKDIKIKFSDRPALRSGSDDIWDEAEGALKIAVEAAGFKYILNPGEGAFYGPKLEFVLKDAIGRDWQCGTLQMDFVLPERLDVNYIDANGQKQRPVMLHRAILGTFERFIGILIENCAGRFPLWLAPIQVAVINITKDQNDYANQVYEKLFLAGIRTVLDISAEKVNYKIRNFLNKKVPLMVIVGQKEKTNQTITLRKFGQDAQAEMDINNLINLITADGPK